MTIILIMLVLLVLVLLIIILFLLYALSNTTGMMYGIKAEIDELKPKKLSPVEQHIYKSPNERIRLNDITQDVVKYHEHPYYSQSNIAALTANDLWLSEDKQKILENYDKKGGE